MEFYEDGDDVVSIWKPEAKYQGWINTLHGGIQAVLLDEICAWVILRKLQTTGVTSKMETRYMKSIETTDPYVTLRARIVEQKRNIIILEATINNCKGELCTKYVLISLSLRKKLAAKCNFSAAKPITKRSILGLKHVA